MQIRASCAGKEDSNRGKRCQGWFFLCTERVGLVIRRGCAFRARVAEGGVFRPAPSAREVATHRTLKAESPLRLAVRRRECASARIPTFPALSTVPVLLPGRTFGARLALSASRSALRPAWRSARFAQRSGPVSLPSVSLRPSSLPPVQAAPLGVVSAPLVVPITRLLPWRRFHSAALRWPESVACIKVADHRSG